MDVGVKDFPRSRAKRYAAVVNAKAGLCSTMGADAVRALFEEKLGPHLVSLRILPPRQIRRALDQALALQPDGVLVLGGDGTARCAAQAAIRRRVPLALLPGGTMNILPKRLYGDASLEDILDALAQGELVEKPVGAGFAGDMPFFVAAAFGYIPLLARAREVQREAKSMHERMASITRLARQGSRLFKPSVRFATDNSPRRDAPALIVAIDDADAMVPGRTETHDTPQGLPFEIVSLHAQSWTALAGITLRAVMTREWRSAENVDAQPARRVYILREGRVRATLDGEPMLLRGPVSITYKKNAFTALALKDLEDTKSRDVPAAASV